LAQRYQFPKWQLRSILRHDVGGGQTEYILQPMTATFGSFRSNSISKFLAGSSGFYLELDAGGDTNALQLELTAASDAGLAILRYE